MKKENRQPNKVNCHQSSHNTVSIISFFTLLGFLCQGLPAFGGVPNGTWLSQPQIRFHSSTNTVSQVMKDIQRQNYKVVFLDYRGVPEEVQELVSWEARAQNLVPVVWIQSPQYRSLTVPELIYEARHGDAIQVDDHFFTNYSSRDFQSLSYKYKKPIFCSIQPFQSAVVSQGRCNQLDVQCYTSQNFQSCIALADRLKAVVSLFHKQTFRYKQQLNGRRFNVFLWPYSQRSVNRSFQNPFEVKNLLSRSFSLLQFPQWKANNFMVDNSSVSPDKSQNISF